MDDYEVIFFFSIQTHSLVNIIFILFIFVFYIAMIFNKTKISINLLIHYFLLIIIDLMFNKIIYLYYFNIDFFLLIDLIKAETYF